MAKPLLLFLIGILLIQLFNTSSADSILSSVGNAISGETGLVTGLLGKNGVVDKTTQLVGNLIRNLLGGKRKHVTPPSSDDDDSQNEPDSGEAPDDQEEEMNSAPSGPSSIESGGRPSGGQGFVPGFGQQALGPWLRQPWSIYPSYPPYGLLHQPPIMGYNPYWGRQFMYGR